MRLGTLGIALMLLAGATATSVPAQEAVLLKHSFKKGDSLIVGATTDTKQTQTVNGQKLETSMNQRVVMGHTVEDVDADGKATLKAKAHRRKFVSDIAMLGKYVFDSTSTERDTGSVMGAALTPLLERLTGSEYQVVANPRGEVTEVKGYTELIADILKDNPLAAQFAGQLGAGGDGPKLGEQQFFVVFHEKPVKPGDTWEVPLNMNLAQFGKAAGKTTYKFEAYDKIGDRKTVRLSSTSEMSLELNIDQGGMKVTGTISTTGATGTIHVDPETGRTVRQEDKLTMSGQLTVEAGGMTIPVGFEQEASVKLEQLKSVSE
jgi:Family of unknown function (DUF6263)